MTPSFQLIGIDHQRFEPLFALTTPQLDELGAQRVFADESPGYPCRISLEDAAVGDELLLLPYQHQPAASPYRASGPIFVKRGAKRRRLPVGEVSPYITRRLISVRAYDAAHCIVAAGVCEGAVVEAELRRHLDDPQVAYLHLHNAMRGCFACQVVRA
jgi:Protein of unknown function (DUF1203)